MSLYVRLNAEYPSDDEFIEAGPMAELLYIRALCFCKRKLIDGTISTIQLPNVAMGIPSPKRHAKRLVDAGLWEETAEGWFIVGWLKWNKSAKEVQSDRETRRVASAKANHDQHHVGEGKKPSARCDFCREEFSDLLPKSAPKSDPSTDPNVLRNRLPKPKPEPEEEPKPEPEEEPKPQTHPHRRDDSPGVDPTAVMRTKVIEAMANARADRSQPTNRSGWLRTVKADIEAEHGDRIDELVAQFPNAPADVIAAAVEGDARSLRYYADDPKPPPEPDRRLTPDERAELIAQGKETA